MSSRRASAEPRLRAAILFIIAMVATVVFAAIADHILGGNAQPLDEWLARTIRRLDSPIADTVMRTFTHVGAKPVLFAMIAVTAALAIRRRWWRAVWVLLANGLVVAGLNRLLKLLFARERPELELEIPLPGSYSFPSGHAMSALAVYGASAAVISYLLPRSRPIVLAVTVPLVIAIGVSRVYLGVHWPLDVLAGFAAAVPPLVVTLHLLRSGPPRSAEPAIPHPQGADAEPRPCASSNRAP